MKRLFAVALSIPVTLLLVLHVSARALCTPMPEVVSWATLHGECVSANVAHYLLALAGAVVIVWALRIPPFPSAQEPARPDRAGVPVLLVAAVAVLNAGLRTSLAAPVVNQFHEGELLAFGAAFQQPEPFLNTALVHGFGTDVLPGLLGRILFPGSVIAGMRLFRGLESILFFAGLVWVLFEIAAAETDARRRHLLQLVAAGLILPLLSLGGFEQELFRKSFFMLQLALLLRALRSDGRGLWIALGASIVPGVLYNYAEGAGFTVVLALALLVARPGRISWAALGGLATAGIAIVVVGVAQLREIGEQIAYWGRFGGRTWMLPLEEEWMQVAFLFAPIVVVQALAFTSLRRDQPEIWVCLLASLSGFRLWTDRADDFHLAIAAISAIPLAFALVLRGLPRPEAGEGRLHPALAPAALLLVGLIPFAPFETLGLPRAVRIVSQAVHDVRTPDAKLVPASYLEAAAAIKPSLGDCFFTLTSEGIWYHLLDRPSCSRFHQVVYARTAEAQQEIVEALEEEKPPMILVENEFWSNHIDGVPVSVTNPVVWRYVMIHYRPDREIGGHKLYRRAERAVSR